MHCSGIIQLIIIFMLFSACTSEVFDTSGTALESSDDGCSLVSVPNFRYFDKVQRHLYVCVNGVLTFEQPVLPAQDTPMPIVWHFVGVPGTGPAPTISAFWVDVDTTVGGSVYYRTASSTDLDLIRAAVGLDNFAPSWGFIASWVDVQPHENPDDYDEGNNTFQAALASDGTHSFVIFNYEEITWTYTKYSLIPVDIKIYAKVGFDAGDSEHYYAHTWSMTPNTPNLTFTSNVNTPGRYVYKVDSMEILPAPFTPGILNASGSSCQQEDCRDTDDEADQVPSQPSDAISSSTIPTSEISAEIPNNNNNNKSSGMNLAAIIGIVVAFILVFTIAVVIVVVVYRCSNLPKSTPTGSFNNLFSISRFINGSESSSASSNEYMVADSISDAYQAFSNGSFESSSYETSGGDNPEVNSNGYLKPDCCNMAPTTPQPSLHGGNMTNDSLQQDRLFSDLGCASSLGNESEAREDNPDNHSGYLTPQCHTVRIQTTETETIPKHPLSGRNVLEDTPNSYLQDDPLCSGDIGCVNNEPEARDDNSNIPSGYLTPQCHTVCMQTTETDFETDF